jgi:ribonuclease Z
MSSRELFILGTASQVPTRARNHNAAYLRWDELGILIDPGEGTQRQMTIAGLAASQITHIFITHFHGDHCLGLASVIQRISLDRVAHTVEVHYPASGQVYFDRLRYASIYYDQAQIAPRPIARSAGLVELARIGSTRLCAAPLDHGVDCYGLRLEEDAGQRMLPEALERAGVRGPMIRDLLQKGELIVDGRRITVDDVSAPRAGQSFAFVMDTRACAGADLLARGADLLVCESTYLSSESEEAWAHHHMTAEGAAQLAARAGARRLVLTHFSQRYTTLEPFGVEARRVFPDVVVAQDLTRVSVPKRADGA